MRNYRIFFCLLASGIVLTACKSRSYVLQRVSPHRIEVTKALDVSPSAEAQRFIGPFRAGVDSLRAPFVGRSECYMSAGRPESLLSNWVADALVDAAGRLGYQADLGICNVGGLRAAMPMDTVRRGDILAISPFSNHLSILKMRGSDVQQVMADIAAVHGEGVSGSARLVITRDGKLVNALLGGKPIEADSLYTVATLDYLAEGNDKLFALKRSVERIDTRELVSDMLMAQLRMLDEQGQQATARIEGRITVASGGEAPKPAPQASSTPAVRKEQDIDYGGQGTRGGGKDLLVVHTNDTHSCIEPLSPLLADTANADKGGYLRRVALLDELRAKHPSLLLFDCGDFSQGSAYYSLYRGDVEVGLMNLMHYDAATIGNHEFDNGVENMARLFRMAKFPIVCCNYDFTGTAAEGLVKPYVVLQREGLKIGVLGVSPQLQGLVAAHTCEGVRYSDPIASAQAVADHLKQVEKCDLVICLSHLGWNIAGVSDEELIPATRNIDIVLGGHSHTYFACPETLKNLDGRVVTDNQMGKNARFVGTLLLHFGRQ